MGFSVFSGFCRLLVTLVLLDWLSRVIYKGYTKTNPTGGFLPLPGVSLLELNWYPRLTLDFSELVS